MDFVTTVVAGVPAINSAVTLAENIGKFVRQGAKLEAEKAIQELQKALLILGQENLQLGQENLGLKRDLEKLKSESDLKQKLKFEYPNYYVTQVDGSKDGPFCRSCKDKDDKLIRLTVRKPDAAWHCDVCKNNFETEAHRRIIEAAIHKPYNSGSGNWMAR